MSTTLYIQTNKSVEVNKREILLKDIAYVFCGEKSIEIKCKECQVMDMNGKIPGVYVMTALDLTKKIISKNSDIEVVHMGDPAVVIHYEPVQKKIGISDWLKAALVAFVLFFGAGFSIMTFNTDVSTKELFSNLYQEVTGMPSSGFTEMELFYSIGIGIGVVFFFNHFSFKKKKKDPSALEVQMNVYENDLETAIIDQDAKGAKGSG